MNVSSPLDSSQRPSLLAHTNQEGLFLYENKGTILAISRTALNNLIAETTNTFLSERNRQGGSLDLLALQHAQEPSTPKVSWHVSAQEVPKRTNNSRPNSQGSERPPSRARSSSLDSVGFDLFATLDSPGGHGLLTGRVTPITNP